MAKDPRSMTPKGRPGSGLATGAARMKAMAAVKKVKKQATGAPPAGYQKRAVAKKVNAPQRKATPAKRGRSSDKVAGRTGYTYGKGR